MACMYLSVSGTDLGPPHIRRRNGTGSPYHAVDVHHPLSSSFVGTTVGCLTASSPAPTRRSEQRNIGGIPEIMVCRILLFMWSVGALAEGSQGMGRQGSADDG